MRTTTNVNPKELKATDLISADRVRGTRVYNSQGQHLGHIEDVMLHKLSGKVAYAIMAFGGFLGIGERYHPLPWSMLTYDLDKGGYTVPLDKETLEQAPSFERHQLADTDEDWRERVYGYYKVPPYWI